MDNSLLEQLWEQFGFKPNANQRAAILHDDGPLFLPAGPGSGKTRVLLWRVTNLIAVREVEPSAVYLSTFTEKAALQLREGLRTLLAAASEHTHKPYDIARMYVGTVHSLCQRMLVEREFRPNRARGRAPVLLDDLDQYLFLSHSRTWNELLEAGGYKPDVANPRIIAYFNQPGTAKHTAATCCMSLFNRLSEECIDPITTHTDDIELAALLKMYAHYQGLLIGNNGVRKTDFALLQQSALNLLESNPATCTIFKHVIVDEYQDTNTVQERIFFRLAAGHKNFCAVGDDDQALYRFRGATVENFVQFPKRCARLLGVESTEIPLNTNYRSRRSIVNFYGDFMAQCDWTKGDTDGSYRVEGKNIKAHSSDDEAAVVASTASDPLSVCSEIAALTKSLISNKRVADPSQIAFLFPSLKSEQAKRMKKALEAEGLRVYAPRAATFLETAEATSMMGLLALIVGRPERGEYSGDYARYHNWLDAACDTAKQLAAEDPNLARFVNDRQREIARAREDYARLAVYAAGRKWDLDTAYDPESQQRPLTGESGITSEAQRRINSKRFNYVIQKRIDDKNPLKLKYVLKRATSIEWSLLDLFYQLTMFEHFAWMFDAAQRVEAPDEGPVCNLALVTQYISRFLDQRAPLISGDLLHEDKLQQMLFGSYLYALHRRGESEYEDAEDPFPKGRVPFLTVHQSKGLEFPVVVLGNPRKEKKLPRLEAVVKPLLPSSNGREPLDKMPTFDTMRMFYVALSRAKNLLIVANYQSQGNRINSEFKPLVAKLPTIPQLNILEIPPANEDDSESPKIYSYTGDFLAYERCPRQYLVFRKFDFVPSRSQTMVFGSLVHRTLDDIHQHLIGVRGAA